MSDRYTVGDVARLRVAITHANAYVDPAALTLSVKDPAGDVVVYTYGEDPEVKKQDTGVFYLDLPLPLEGTYYWRWASSGTYAAACESQLLVTDSAFQGI